MQPLTPSVILLILVSLSCNESLGDAQFATQNFIYNNSYQYNVTHNVTVNSTTQHIMDFVEDSGEWSTFPTRLHVSTNATDTQHPLFVSATLQRGSVLWELPLWEEPGAALADMARTLCPRDADLQNTSQSRPTLQLYTRSPRNVTSRVRLHRVRDFRLAPGVPVSLRAAPETPHYYYFSFEPAADTRAAGAFNYTVPKSVVLMLESDDERCAIVSVQNDSCPVLDSEDNVRQRGYHLSMTTRGGITLTQAMFPRGFYVVLVVTRDQQQCGGGGGGERPGLPRDKGFRVVVVATISYGEYAVAAAAALALVLAFYVMVVLVSCCSPRPSPCTATEETLLTEENVPTLSQIAEVEPAPGPSGAPPPYTNQVSLSEGSEESSVCDAEESLPLPLTLHALSRRRRLDTYLWSVLTVSVVYALPVVQLLVTYQNMVFRTGEQDLCYYNFLCAHPLGPLSDFNHVFSNVGYVVLGLAFSARVWARRVRHVERAGGAGGCGRGVPPHWGMLLGMGVALAMEGLLSACYHLCPNSMNFQFDSSFMYLIAVLCMVKLYQSRHPDVNARAHHTFLLIAALQAIGVVGIIDASLAFWVMFTLLHLATCLLLTLNIYYVGKLRLGAWGAVWGAVRTRRLALLRPQYGARFVLLAIANLANWALAAYGVYEHKKDFARHLLAILMGNTILYTLFYVAMKLVHRERILPHTWLYLVAAHAAWFAALYLFLDSKTKWSESPAMSRTHNAECSWLHFYDSHDAWHLLSAAALFLSFNLLLTLDDPLQDTPRHLIPVF